MEKKIKNLINSVGEVFKKKKITLVTAESCTGGGLAYYISLNPEASSLLERGFISYSNHSKENLLKVSPYILQTKGAVSKETAIAMAKGALENSVAQVAIAITGIAGPDKNEKGDAKNQGVVWICCISNSEKPLVLKKLIKGNRDDFCHKIIFHSLTMLLKYIKNMP